MTPPETDRDELVGIGALAAQFFLALGGGAWAAIPASVETQGDLMPYSAVATAFALALCIFGARGVRLGLSLVAAAATAPAFLRSLTGPRQPPSAADRAWEWRIRLASTVVQTLLLAFAGLLIAAAVTWFSPAGFLELAWRYLAVVAVLSLFTWKAVDVI